MPHLTKHIFELRNVLIKAACFWFALVLVDFALVYFFGPQFWSYAGYVFGNDVRVTLAVLMFIKGAVFLALGLVWASGSMETVFQGGNLKTNPYFRKDDWKQRREQTEKQNEVGKILTGWRSYPDRFIHLGYCIDKRNLVN